MMYGCRDHYATNQQHPKSKKIPQPILRMLKSMLHKIDCSRDSKVVVVAMFSVDMATLAR